MRPRFALWLALTLLLSADAFFFFGVVHKLLG